MKNEFIDRLIEANVGYQVVFSVVTSLLFAITFFFVVATIETTQVTQVGSPTFQFTGNFVGYFLAIISVAVAILIAIRQTRQLRYQNQQLEELKEISINIQKERVLAENIPRFFQSIAKSNKRCDCFVPGLDEGKPLPNVKAGDHIALQTYDKFLTPKQLQLIWVNAESTQAPKGHSIQVGSPKANGTLHQLCNEEAIKSIDLPVWFSEVDGRVTIYDRIEDEHSFSPADPLYDDNHEDHKIVKENDRVEDRAILARFTVEGSLHFVVAGIHQYGTWIAAELLDELITGKLEHRELLMSFNKAAMEEADFVAHIVGFFSSDELKSSGYRLEHLYTRFPNKWRKVADFQSI